MQAIGMDTDMDIIKGTDEALMQVSARDIKQDKEIPVIFIGIQEKELKRDQYHGIEKQELQLIEKLDHQLNRTMFTLIEKGMYIKEAKMGNGHRSQIEKLFSRQQEINLTE
jgi:hypothetical protein